MANPKIKLHPLHDIAAYTEGYEVVSTQLGGDGRIYVLLIDRIPEREDGMFVPAKLRPFRTYKALIIGDSCIQEVLLWGQTFNYHYLQPLGEHLLLVGARCTRYGDGKHDLNAKVIDAEGTTVREFLLGDGIQDVQVTEDGTIWTGYFDEGVFGNYGWGEPVGAQGLIAWDDQGNKRFENQAADIADCYALNVVNEQEVWFYYYADFKLGLIRGGTHRPQTTFINPGLSGSSGLCTDGYHFLFDAGYGKHGSFVLKKQDSPGRLTKGQRISFVNEDSQPLQAARQSFRQHQLLLSEGSKLYLTDVGQLAAVLD